MRIEKLILLFVVNMFCSAMHGEIIYANTVEGVKMKFTVISTSDKTCEVGYQAISKETSGEITIPQQVNGYKVVGIGGFSFSACNLLTCVIIPNTVTYIGDYAFDSCKGLTSVTLPCSVTEISSTAFYYCSNMNSVKVENGNSTYDSRNECNAIIETATNTLVVGCKNTTIPLSVTYIGYYAFSSCDDMTSFDIPTNIRTIGESSFAGCKNLTSIRIPNSIYYIGKSAFFGCTGLNSIVSEIESPFDVDKSAFRCRKDGKEIPLDVPLYVPYGTKTKYEAKSGWNQLTILEMGPDWVELDGLYYHIISANDYNNEHGTEIYSANSEVATVTIAPDDHPYSGEIIIPAMVTHEGKTYVVEGVEEDAFKNSKITSVVLPFSIKSIGSNAFSSCSSLSSITMESAEPIGIEYSCFFNEYSCATLYVPKGSYEAYSTADNWKYFSKIIEPTYIDGDTFAASITAGSSTTKATFVVIDATNKYVSVGSGEESAIADYTSGNVVIPTTVKGYDGQTYQVKQISDAAFFDCYELTSIELPSGITAIGRVSFYDCAGLTSFTIPTTVTSLGEEAFSNCYNMTSINIPASVTSIGEAAFYGCSKLNSVTVNWNEPVSIDNECFTNAKNATLNIPKGSYGKYATADNWNNFKTIKEPAHSVGDTFAAYVTASGSQVDATFKVTNTSSRYVIIGDGEDAAIDIFASGNVVIPSSVKGYDAQTYTVRAVSDAAFFGCENITSVSLPSGLTGIGNSSFLRCYNLASINIPTSVTKIGTEAFFYCENLTSISIPKNVTSIGTRAFKNCNLLTSVTVNWVTPITIDNECFSNAANATLNVPYGSKERYEAAIGWKNFKNIVEMAPKDGDVFTALTAEDVKMTFTIISASAKTCKVGDGSSASISTSTDGLVTIPTTVNGFTVTQISSKAFYNCNQITATEIPTSISSIGTYAFSGCDNLTSVTVGWDEPIAINTNCFSNAANSTLYVPVGTNYDYSVATGWNDFGQIANKTTSRLFADNVIVCRGGLITLPIELSNDENIRSFQFELVLPEGISVATDTQGNPMAALSQRANSTHRIIGSPLSNGNYQFNIMSKSFNDDIIQDSEGRIASITLKVWKNVTPRDYAITITDSELNVDGADLPLLLPETQSKLTVSDVLLGDTNDDKRVSVTDISNVIDYILHKNVPNFVWHAANASGDERISVSDISTIIDIILHKVVYGEIQATKKDELDSK